MMILARRRWQRSLGAGALVLVLSALTVAGHDAALGPTRQAVAAALGEAVAETGSLSAGDPSGPAAGAVRRLACRIATSLRFPAWFLCRPG